MSEMTPRRLSYAARILLVPLGESGHRVVEQMAAKGLTEVQVVTEHAPSEVAVRDINADTTTMRRIDELATESDMVILIGSVLPQVPVGFATTMAEAARQSGNLLAGVLVDQQDWDSQRGAEAMAVLRMELDMLVSITQVDLATAFVDVLKGGYRTAGACAPVLSTPRI
ncbi:MULTISPECIES: hypothetical protein [Rhodococcus]|uniref:NAD(P)-binding domain-containing protein n=1 Tax=Rhodococcus opacus RKJ300 = JCM 13270 TaxID=1165867 RepID=I0WVU8_RHOOP|nr:MULTISPECIES: hypothetical protein [Rhodococcus]EID80514.1 hypothetical protein W59_07749 [Rhodococcus opacus RKJ300 = JCM 13270]QQZ19608.1 hypothetical protein GO592_42150 [Rhodococcus sp. 21391]